MTKQAQHAAQVRVVGGALEVDGWSTERPEVVHWFEERAESDAAPRADELLDSVVAAGVLALRTANVAIDADYVGREFERLLGAVEETVTGHGDRIDQLFDPDRCDSVIAAIREVMSDHVDGRDSKLAKLLDLSHESSPLRALAAEMVKIREELQAYRRDVEARDAADDARADERELGTAKGRDYEDVVVESLGAIAAVCGDSVEAVGDVTGCVGGSKHGDVVVTLNPRDTRGLPVRIGVEAKDRTLNTKTTRTQLDATMANRDATASIAVFARGEQMPKGTFPFAELGENRFVCVLDKHEAEDDLVLSLAYRVARHWALADATAGAADLDVRAVRDSLEHARNQLQSFTLLKRKLTSLETGFSEGVTGIREEVERARLALTGSLDRLDEAVRVPDAADVAAPAA